MPAANAAPGAATPADGSGRADSAGRRVRGERGRDSGGRQRPTAVGPPLAPPGLVRRAYLRDRPAGRHLPPLHRREDGHDPDPQGRRRPPAAVPRHLRSGVARRRAGPALDGVPSSLREQRAVLRQLHELERRHARGALPRVADRSRQGRAGDGPRHPRRRPALRQPQRRAAAVRPGRTTVRRHGRRRQRRRPAGPRAGPAQPPRQAAAHQRGRLAGAGRRLRQGAAQPVALLVRPQDRRALDRRRRSGLAGGDRLPPPRPARPAPTSAGTATRGRRCTTRRSPPAWTGAG